MKMLIQTVRLGADTLDALKRIGARFERPVGWLIRRAVEEFVSKEDKKEGAK